MNTTQNCLKSWHRGLNNVLPEESEVVGFVKTNPTTSKREV
jgi:hypothetical protein